jgi:F-type H+-transporting ATPase subunit delta
MLSAEVAIKYATALFLSVKERGLVDRAYDEFQSFRKVLKTQPALLNLLAGPRVSEDEKVDMLRRMFGDSMHRLHVEFLAMLVRKRRIAFLPEIIEQLARLIEEEKGIVRARVITAVALKPEEEQRLIAKLEVYSGKSILLQKRVDPGIVGGMIIMLGDEIIDGSIRHGLNTLNERLARVRVH